MSIRSWIALLVLGGLLLWSGLKACGNLERGSVAPLRVAAYKLPLKVASVDADIAHYKARADANPTGFMDRAALAQAYLAKARETRDAAFYVLAEQSARESLKSMGVFNAPAELVMANLDVARHDFTGGLARLDKVLAQDPRNEQARALRVTALLALGRVIEAGRLADGLALEAPGITTAVFRAQTLMAAGRDPEAIAVLWKGIDREQPGEVGPSVQARVLLARAYARHGKLALAEAVLTSAAAIRPDPTALSDLGRLDLALKRYRQAHEHFSDAYTLSRDPAALLGVARALEGLKLEREASETLRGVEDAYRRELQGPDNIGHRRALASVLLDRQEVPEAVQLMQAELSQRRDFDTLMTAARALRMAGQPRRAWPLCQEAFARGYRDAPAWHERGLIAHDLGHQDEEAHCEGEAVRLNPAYAGEPNLPAAPVEH